MKTYYVLAGFMLIATVVVLALTLGDFMALHDIQREYVSTEVLDSLGISISDELPDWTATAGEWAMVQFSFLARSAFLILNAITLSLIFFILRRQDPEGKGSTVVS